MDVIRVLKKHHIEIKEPRMGDGFIWLLIFLDRLLGTAVYRSIEIFFYVLGTNPFNNGLVFIAWKKESDKS